MQRHFRHTAVAFLAACAIVTGPVAALADSCQFSAEGDPAPHPIGGWQGRCTTSEGYQCTLFDGTPDEHSELDYVITDPKNKNLIASDPNIITLILASKALPTNAPVSVSVDGKTLAASSYKHTDPEFNDVNFTFRRSTPIFKSSNVTFHVGSWKRMLNFASLQTDAAVKTIVDCTTSRLSP